MKNLLNKLKDCLSLIEQWEVVGTTRRMTKDNLSTTWEFNGSSKSIQEITFAQKSISNLNDIYFEESIGDKKINSVKTSYKYISRSFFGNVTRSIETITKASYEDNEEVR